MNILAALAGTGLFFLAGGGLYLVLHLLNRGLDLLLGTPEPVDPEPLSEDDLDALVERARGER